MEAQGLEQGESFGSSPEVTTSAPVQEAPAPKSDERMLRQSEVNDIVGRAKYEAVEGYKRREQTQSSASQNSQPQYNPSETDFRRLAAEEAQRLRDTWVADAQQKAESDYAQKVVQNFWDKVNQGKDKYEDFESVTGDIEFSSFPNVVQLLAEVVDNSHDVLYELGKNRINLAQLEQLSRMSPRDAKTHVQRLSQSIKDNEQAGKIRVPNSPLSQLKPSNVGTDTGKLSIKDLRAQSRFKT